MCEASLEAAILFWGFLLSEMHYETMKDSKLQLYKKSTHFKVTFVLPTGQSMNNFHISAANP